MYIVLPILPILILIVVILVVFLATVGNYFYGIILKPGGFAKLSKNKEAPPPDPFFTEAERWLNGMKIDELEMQSNDGLVLRGYYIKNDNQSGRLAFLIHGYNGKASEMACYARIYYEMGFDIFAPDNRAHGKSEGNAIGLGWLDSKDCMQWMELLKSKCGNPEIIVHGHSMGGTTALIMAGKGIDVKGIVSDCAFDSAVNILTRHLKKMFNLPAFPLLPIASLICKLRAGYFFGEANAAAYVKLSKIPMFFIHGSNDSFVPVSMVYNLYNAADPSLRELWVVDGARHIESVKVDNEGYISHIKTFILRNFSCQQDNLLIK